MGNDNGNPWPITIGQLRARRSGNAADWSPLDCLKDMVRAIEANELNPDGLIICCYNETDNSGIDIKFSQAMPNVLMASGTLQRVSSMLEG